MYKLMFLINDEKKRGDFMKYKLVAMLLCVVLAGSLLMGCDFGTHAEAFTPINKAKSIKSKETTQVSELDEDYVNGLNDFAYHIFSELDDGENIFISPYSISSALSMLYNGADGETRTEMAELLGYDLLKDGTKEYSEVSNNYMNANGKLLIETLEKADPKVKLSIANSIWLSKDAKFKDSAEAAFLAPVRNYYKGDIFSVDFKEDKTLDQVNSWVSDKTEGMIDPFIKSFSDKDMLRLFLVNAIYFNGKWTVPFSPDDTLRIKFNGLDSIRNVDMMCMSQEEYRYYSENGIRGIELPYGNGRLTMNVLIPEDTMNETIGDLYREISTDEMNAFLNKLDNVQKTVIGKLELPKFEMEYGMKSLNDALINLGMNTAFDESKADFGLIYDELFVSLVGHTAKIQVEEWGTKAAAVTAIECETTSALVEEPLDFIVDVPFVFFIRDTQTGAILFMGEMNNLN